MKRKWIIAGVLLLIAAALLPLPAANLHFFLLREREQMTTNLLTCWQVILTTKNAAKFYLIFTALVMLMLLWTIVSSNHLNYRSGMQVITPDIKTPCPAGQGEYGTARWLPEKQYSRYFTVWKVGKKNSTFKELLSAGKSDRKEIQNAKIP